MVNHSYEYLSTLFGEAQTETSPEYGHRKRIIAIGGAKGGIGKSVFAANLGTMLFSRVSGVLMVDLDLGGSTFISIWAINEYPRLRSTIFLTGK
jgi:Mrp family chromosome partitioning ATPase